ncbi:hypothetical protein GBZ26_04035 [Azospirillum formosense]|uniref:DNA circulation N-terminal domain-containing protein n=1 Tax=Azospirillum formosense TaxID=861533 RepID=A0ABX2KRN5_9PROT|nr:DNA circularization N-terminal domain-containing protein [Azospirillum formosense]MBY3755730.1 DNA circularization N-terminal domain-containing protein [Azospirillum formosense]NUB18394.1 hypothetical protein [Azospirillum formosense]
MAWRDQLRPASFRGVPFKVDGDELAAGRRVQLHEYPQRDKPFVEDLGRATRKVTLTAYVIGPQYMAQRDRLLAALEEAGPGELVHPHFGTLRVAADGECRVAHSADEGGMCRFSLSFVEAGELSFPAAKVNSAAQTKLKADALSTASAGDFAKAFGVAGYADFVREGAVADLTKAVSLAERVLRGGGAGGSSLLSGLLSDTDRLFGSPWALAQRVLGLIRSFTATGGGGSATTSAATGWTGVARSSPAARPLAALLHVASYTAPAPAYTRATPARQQQATNSTALAALVRRSALVHAAEVSAAADWPVHQEVIAARDELAARIDAETLRPDVPDDTFRALTDLRVAVVQDLTARSAGAARLATVTPTAVQPAVVLAYDLYEDAGRGEEIVTRNRVAHPGFVPPAPLKVLT